MKEKYISRVDSFKSSMFGYLLRLYRDGGVLYQEWFSDKAFGGKGKALKAAINKRDEKIVEYNYMSTVSNNNRYWQAVQDESKTRSNTGRLGVYESKDYKTLKDGTRRECPYIAVHYVIAKGKSKTKKFYYGKKRTRDQALKEAFDFRSAKEISARAAAVAHNRAVQKELIEEENKLLAKQRRGSKTKKSSFPGAGEIAGRNLS